MRSLSFSLIFTLILAASPASAQTGDSTTYQVNAIVFGERPVNAPSSEQWTQEPVTRLRHLNEAMAPVAGLTPDSALNSALSRLSSNHHYRVLAVMNWIQPGVGRAQAVPMRVQDAIGSLDGTIRVYKLQYLHADLNLAYRPGGQVVGTAAEPTLVAGPAILNAIPAMPVPAPTDANNPQPVYRLIEARRVNIKKIAYFDHPKFGVLVLVTPVKTKP